MYIPSHDQHLTTTAFAFFSHSPGFDLCSLLISGDLNNRQRSRANTDITDIRRRKWTVGTNLPRLDDCCGCSAGAGKSLDGSRQSLWVTGNLPRIRVPPSARCFHRDLRGFVSLTTDRRERPALMNCPGILGGSSILAREAGLLTSDSQGKQRHTALTCKSLTGALSLITPKQEPPSPIARHSTPAA